MTAISDIAKAWLIAMDPTEEQRAIADERRDICNRCEYLKMGICSKCLCPVSKKVYVPNDKDGCPIGKWPKKFE